MYDADIIINGLPSTETRNVFERIARVWNATRDKSQADPVVVSLSKGVETSLEPHPHIITPTRVIHEVTGVPLSNLMYLGKAVAEGRSHIYFLDALQFASLSVADHMPGAVPQEGPTLPARSGGVSTPMPAFAARTKC